MEKLEIPAGEECEGCPFFYYDQNPPGSFSFGVCGLYGDNYEEFTRRGLLCLSDHPHGAVITITNKEPPYSEGKE